MSKLSKKSTFSIISILILLILSVGSFFLWQKLKEPPELKLQAISFAELPNWQKDRLSDAWPAFLLSCQKITSLDSNAQFLNGQSASDWQPACSIALSLKNPSEETIRQFFETHFVPYKISSGYQSTGLFTGYYEPEIAGARTKSSEFSAAIYNRPDDLVMIEDLGIFRKQDKGVRIAGRVQNGKLIPYHTHKEINKGALSGNELIWVKDAADAFFAQIQGSATIKLENGEKIRLTYAGTNGHPYTPIGRILVEQQAISKDKISMQTIRAWLKAHQNEALDIMEQNASFVFFKETKGPGPLGAQGVPLTKERSMAIDPVFISYGTPLWLDISHPKSKEERLQRLVIAQDKGGAIKGHVRGDLFWGTGEDAGEIAGIMKSTGCYYALLPKHNP